MKGLFNLFNNNNNDNNDLKYRLLAKKIISAALGYLLPHLNEPLVIGFITNFIIYCASKILSSKEALPNEKDLKNVHLEKALEEEKINEKILEDAVKDSYD